MTKLATTIAVTVLGLVALGAVASGITAILGAVVPLVLVVGVVAAVLRIVWFHTRRW